MGSGLGGSASTRPAVRGSRLGVRGSGHRTQIGHVSSILRLHHLFHSTSSQGSIRTRFIRRIRRLRVHVDHRTSITGLPSIGHFLKLYGSVHDSHLRLRRRSDTRIKQTHGSISITISITPITLCGLMTLLTRVINDRIFTPFTHIIVLYRTISFLNIMRE